MKPHEIKFEDFQQWLGENEAEFASSTRERKRLIVKMNGGIKITVGGKTVWEGVQAYPAVKKYNSITEPIH